MKYTQKYTEIEYISYSQPINSFIGIILWFFLDQKFYAILVSYNLCDKTCLIKRFHPIIRIAANNGENRMIQNLKTVKSLLKKSSDLELWITRNA